MATFEHFPQLTSLHSLNSTTMLPPSAPVVEVRAKQKSRRQRRNTTRPALSKPMIVPQRPRVVTPWQRHVWSLRPDEALVYARKEIDNSSPILANDPDLYAPVFRNVSLFRSLIRYDVITCIAHVLVSCDSVIRHMYGHKGNPHPYNKEITLNKRQLTTKEKNDLRYRTDASPGQRRIAAAEQMSGRHSRLGTNGGLRQTGNRP
ncbi:hypothetical protein Syun_011231 [Stephania yunnanensis]|uniref:Uncharacterized protein n=1 Tax=Stephania yunnanensis TaxID=152371 RepID=A0AAP0JX51_9MAGN